MKIAGVQMDVTLGDTEGNLGRMIEFLGESRHRGAGLTIFPECALTGYCFDDLDEARACAEPMSGSSIRQMAAACHDLGGFAVFGLLETDGDRVYNAAVLVGAEGPIASYRKVHLPYLGADRFVTYGDLPFSVQEAAGIRMGLQICYDCMFAEASRVHALAGADLIVLPTNWPRGAESVADYVVNTRAMENAVYFAAVNRIGTERGFTFVGRSRICGPAGETLANARPDHEEILYAEIDLERARNKRVARPPQPAALDRLADRRPEFYGPVVEPHDLPRPGRDR